MREVRRLSAHDTERLGAAPFTYGQVGATKATFPSGYPAGYRVVRRTAVVGRGREHFTVAARRLTTWEMHRRAGLRVDASGPLAQPGTVLVQRLGVGPLALRIPCRVVYAVEEPDRVGFAYGTLPGHPETGEERFDVALEGGHVRFTVSVFSNAATVLARLGGPVTWWAQEAMLRRYAAALT